MRRQEPLSDNESGSDGEREQEAEEDCDEEIELEPFSAKQDIIFYDLFEKKRSLLKEDCRTLFGSAEEAIAERFVHFAAQHFVRPAATRRFPEFVDLMWLQDCKFSSWIASNSGGEVENGNKDEDCPFSEYTDAYLNTFSSKNLLLIPLFVDNHCSLFVIRGLRDFVGYTGDMRMAIQELSDTLEAGRNLEEDISSDVGVSARGNGR